MARMTGSRFFAEAMRGYGVTHLFYVNSIIGNAMREIEKTEVQRVITHAFPKPLSIRQYDGRGMQKCSAQSLGGKTATRSLPVGLVVVTRYRQGAHWRPRKISPAEGLLALLANAPTALTRSEDAMSTLKQVVTNAVTLRGNRPDADKVAPALLDYMTHLSVRPGRRSAVGTGLFLFVN